jgi:hypothetical protein
VNVGVRDDQVSGEGYAVVGHENSVSEPRAVASGSRARMNQCETEVVTAWLAP